MQNRTGNNTLQVYRKLARLRKQETFLRGSMQYVVITDNVFSFVRHSRGHPTYLVALNFGKESSVDDHSYFLSSNHNEGYVEIISGNSTAREETKLNLKKLKLVPGEGLVIKINQ